MISFAVDNHKPVNNTQELCEESLVVSIMTNFSAVLPILNIQIQLNYSSLRVSDRIPPYKHPHRGLPDGSILEPKIYWLQFKRFKFKIEMIRCTELNHVLLI